MIGTKVRPTAFRSGQRGAQHQTGNSHRVASGQALGAGLRCGETVQCGQTFAQILVVTNYAGMTPQQGPELGVDPGIRLADRQAGGRHHNVVGFRSFSAGSNPAHHLRGDGATHHNPLQQGVGGQPIGAVHAAGGGLTHHPQPRFGGSAGHVGSNAAHAVVGGGRNGQQIGARVDTFGHRQREHGGKASGEVLAYCGTSIEIRRAASHHLGVNSSRHDVTRGQLGVGVAADHESLAQVIDQDRSFAPQRLRQQRQRVPARCRQRGGVELHHLQVGKGDAGPSGHSHRRPCHLGRVGGGSKQVTIPSGTEHDGAGQMQRQSAFLISGQHPNDVLVSNITDQIQHRHLLVHGDGGRGPHGGHQCSHDLRAGRVSAGVHDTAGPVARLSPQTQRPRRIGVEPSPERTQPGHHLGGLIGDSLGRKAVPDAARYGHGVLGMSRSRIVRGQGGSHPALRPGTRSPSQHRVDQDRCLAQRQRGRKGGNPGPHHQHPVASYRQVNRLHVLAPS